MNQRRSDQKPQKQFQARRLSRLGEPEAVRKLGQLPKAVARPPDDLVVVGRVQGPFGLDGRVRIDPDAGEDSVLPDLPSWWIRGQHGSTLHTCDQVRWHGSSLVAQLEGVADRTAAERLTGAEVLVRRAEFPEVDDDEVYWTDLIDLMAVHPDGHALGKVTDVFDNGVHGVLEISPDHGAAFLVPLVDRHVTAVDPEQGRIVVDWDPAWL